MDVESGREWDIPYCVIYAVGAGNGLWEAAPKTVRDPKKDCSGFSAKSLL